MKRSLLLITLFICCFQIGFSQAGTLDTTFGKKGIVTTDSSEAKTVFTSSAVQKDGKIVVAGYIFNGTNYDFAVLRYNTDGSLDKTFSSDGIQVTDIGFLDNRANAVAIQTDGKIVLAGYASNGTNNDFAVARYNNDGSLDKSFSSDGIQTTDFGGNEPAQSIALQTDGKIVVAGSYALARYNADGSLDATFGNNGKQIPNCNVTTVKLQKDGKIVVAGSVTTPEEYGGDGFLAVGRYNSDGSIDSSFSEDGILTAGVSNFFSDDPAYGSNIKATSLYIQNDNKIIVGASGGYYERGTRNFHLCIARLNSDGSFDTSFAGDGTQIGYFKNNSDDASVAVQDNGKILVQCNLYGYDEASEIRLGYGIARLNIDGTYDSTFATDGLLYSPQDQIVNIQSISIANDRLYAAGYGSTDNKIYIPGYGENVNKYGFLSSYFLTDNKAPTVSLTAPKNNATYLAPAAHIRFFAVATDNDGAISKVEFYNGTKLLHTEYKAPYGFAWRNVPLGNYTLTAKAYDNSGNVTTSAPVHISVVPNKPPVVSITKPNNNQSFAAPGYIHLEAAASDTDGRVTNVKFYNGTSLLRTEYEYPYTYHWENVPVGTYTITTVATDNWGAHTTSAPVTIKVTSANAMIVSKKPANDKMSVNDAVSLSLYPNPATNIVNIYTKGLQQNKQAIISIISASGIVMKTMQTNSSTQTQINVSTLAKGMYTIKIISGDKVLYKQFVKL